MGDRPSLNGVSVPILFGALPRHRRAGLAAGRRQSPWSTHPNSASPALEVLAHAALKSEPVARSERVDNAAMLVEIAYRWPSCGQRPLPMILSITGFMMR